MMMTLTRDNVTAAAMTPATSTYTAVKLHAVLAAPANTMHAYKEGKGSPYQRLLSVGFRS